MTMPNNTRAGFVSLVGAPNAGKSSLLNRFVGTKVSIVTHKVQTTRAAVRGIAIADETQIVFVDTPGIFRPKRQLDRAMVTSAWAAAGDADITALLIDSERGIDEEVARILDRLATHTGLFVLVLNKIDRISRPDLLQLSADANARTNFEQTFMISAKTGEGCDDLFKYLTRSLPQGSWFYPEDQISDMPLRLMAAEITREKLYLRLHQEIPYATHVETESWTVREDGSVRIDQVVYVERAGQKKIVLGKSGQTIKAIGAASRKEISQALEQPVHLFLFVKVRENWGRDPERYAAMGLDFDR